MRFAHSGRVRRYIVEDVLALHWCRRCFGLVWRGHRAIHDKWHEHLEPDYEAAQRWLIEEYGLALTLDETHSLVDAALSGRSTRGGGLMSDRRPEKLHVHEIEGGFILHADHDLGEGAEALDPIPHEGHQHLMALIARNYVNEISGPAESVRRGVESGTIKGEVVETENCGREPNCTCPGFIEHWTRPGTYLLIGPVSDGGSET